MEQSPQVQEVHSDSKHIQNYTDWFEISNHNGWLVYKKELEDLIVLYTQLMENVDITPEMLKNYQLIRKGLKVALFIPVVLENKAKIVRKKTLKDKVREGFNNLIGRK